ncbi:2-amino-4-hydroxy-6-hydroxymethyldihydropteridine diphosphokinase [Vibrio sp. TRT 21S02]|uniref:2-amino-4-hydroxy-6- hydroxymethyldihydropteridine diphosphokinase n=1 Tax=unclassified Vibrio TaxID=2614977 RepID=UPI00349F69B1
MITTYIGVGSNIERKKHVEIALKELCQLGQELKLSTIYECEPVGFKSDAFYNLVVEMKTRLELRDFSQALRTIERAWGREENAQKFQPRTIDLDIILFGDMISENSPEIPRSDIYKYPFVIQPLYELCPERIIPKDGRTVQQIWQNTKQLDSLIPVELWFDINA